MERILHLLGLPQGWKINKASPSKESVLHRASSWSLLIVVINLGCRRAEVQHLDFAAPQKAPFEELWWEEEKKTGSSPQVLSHPALLGLMKVSFTLSSRRHTAIRLPPTQSDLLLGTLCKFVTLSSMFGLASSRWVKKWRAMLAFFFLSDTSSLICSHRNDQF